MTQSTLMVLANLLNDEYCVKINLKKTLMNPSVTKVKQQLDRELRIVLKTRIG